MEPHGLPTDVETLADLLLAAGYSTHAVGRIAGKWTTTKKGAKSFCRKKFGRTILTWTTKKGA